MIANNRVTLLHGFRASGMSPTLASSMLEAVGTVAAHHPGSREEALTELQNTFERLLRLQRSHIASSELSAVNISRYLNQGLDAIPLLRTGLGSQLRAEAARVGAAVGGMYERARNTVNDVTAIINPPRPVRYSTDPDAISRVQQVARQVAAAASIRTTPKLIARIQTESRRLEAELKEAISSSAAAGSLRQLMMRITRGTPVGAVTSTTRVNPDPEYANDPEGKHDADTEELEWDDSGGEPGRPPDEPPGGGGAGGLHSADRIPYVLHIGGRPWTIKDFSKLSHWF